MAAISIFLLLLFYANIKLNIGRPVVVYQEPADKDNFNITSHLEFAHIKKICGSRHNTTICKSNTPTVKLCGMRYFRNQLQFKDFENSCYMFMSNMCDNPGEEYHILSSGACKKSKNPRKQIKARRDESDEEADEESTAYQNEEETNVEHETETYTEGTEQSDENYTENQEEGNTHWEQQKEDKEENAESENDKAEQNETHEDNQEQGNTEAQDKENQLGNSEEEQNKSKALERNGGDQETTTNINDEETTKSIEKENNDVTTQNIDYYIETTGDSESDVTKPKTKIKHFKAAARKGPTTKKVITTTKSSIPKTTKKNTQMTATKTTKKLLANTKKPSTKPLTKKPSTKPPTKKPATNTKAKKATTKWVQLYPVNRAFDDDICPLSCPTTYSPVCVSVNRGYGKDFRFFTFINHCLGDLFYCKHANDEEFKPPLGETEKMVVGSQLSWSFCAASRYIQFARFAEVASSMGHYGWLAGDYRPTHIMEPHQRIPGYG